MDIDSWLRGIGLAQYGELFRANDIDGNLLHRLSGDDLKDIGVASLGHRKKLLEAIATLDATPEILSPAPVRHDSAAWSGTPPSNGNVRRPRRLDRDVDATRSGGYARSDPRLSERGRGRDHPVRGPRREVHGRRRARLFRLAKGARG